MALTPGTKLGPYEIVSLAGAGGMGEVYRGRDSRLQRAVAIKVLPPAFSLDAERLQRFQQEARALSALNHPNLLAVFDVGVQDNVHYLVSEYLEGQTLRERMNLGLLTQQKLSDYAIQLANGLAAAHEKGITHRDLKPENLFITRDDRIKILDFGLARQATAVAAPDEVETLTAPNPTSAGVVLGTPGYMSPEQVRGLIVDPRSDIFSFGAILYEMSSGQRAFESDSTVETMSAILKQDPPRLIDGSLPASPGLQRIIRRCLEKDRLHRFQSAKDIAYALEAVGGLSVNLAPVVASAHSRKLSILISAVVLGAAMIAGVITFRSLGKNAPTFKQVTYRQGSLQAARFGPDGTSAIYSAQWEGGQPQIQTSRLGDFEFRSLGLPAGTLAAVSSQGQIAILLGCEPFFVSDCGGTLAQVPAAGTAPRELLEHVHYADWSPDGKNLAVVVQEPNGRNRLEYPIGHVLYETSGWIGTARISPDGKLVAFANHPLPNDDRGDVDVVDPAGQVHTLASSMASVEGVAWRSQKEVWFAASDGDLDQSAWSDSLYSVDLKANTRLIAHFPGIIRLHDVSSDGRVLFSREAWRERLIGLFPGDAVEHPYSWLDWSVPMGSSLSADGSMLLFTEAGAAASDAFVPYLRPTNGSSAVRLGKGSAIALSPDGKWAAVADLGSETLSLLPTGAGNARAMDKGSIEQYDFPGWWSSDGKTISFAAQERGRGLSVYSQPASGGPPRRITPELQYIGMLRPHFAVSYDGRLVAIIPAGASKIHLFDSSGTDLGELHGSHEDEVPAAFTAEGRVLVGPKQGQWPLDFFVIDSKTGVRARWRELAPLDRAGLRTDWNIGVTPDLKYYAYSLTQATSELYVMESSK